MTPLSAQTLAMAIQAIDAEIRRVKDAVDGDIAELEPDDQEFLLAYSQAAAELKAAYLQLRLSAPGIPPYGHWVNDT